MRRDKQHRKRGGNAPSQGKPQGIDPVLAAAVDAMNWRLSEAATRIGEATDALTRGNHERTMEKLFDLEPLMFEAQRILSGAFLLAKEEAIKASHRAGENG